MTNILLLAIGLPLWIILVFIFASKYPDRLQSWTRWFYGIWAVTLLARIYQGVAHGRYGFEFWIAVVMFLLLVPMFVLHFRHRKAKDPETETC